MLAMQPPRGESSPKSILAFSPLLLPIPLPFACLQFLAITHCESSFSCLKSESRPFSACCCNLDHHNYGSKIG
ncbi:hypothetical protein AAHA92_14930 [Salvia divinorum]|uniref:Secreted protein n=1 Tax=Salvia divinorum TaxID=28513 RepID=A0ABD1HGF2_SALDI